MPETDKTRTALYLAAFAILCGLAVMILMAVKPEGLRADLWVAEIAAASFVCAGAAIAAQGLGHLRVSRLFGVCAVWCLLVPGAWIALSPKSGSCTAALSFVVRSAGSLECRIVFGIGALITLACAIAMTLQLRRP